MATPFVANISTASRQAWPEVSAAVEQSFRSARELAGIAEEALPQVQQYVANGHGPTKLRRVCEETVWVLARLGWLRTDADRRVIEAAVRWYEVGPDAEQIDYDAADDELVNAVKSLPHNEKEN